MASKLKWINHKSTFLDILKAQRGTSKYTDATLAVDGNFYPVHKLVMSTCSEYFNEIFERTDCKSPVIVLKDVQCHDIEALLDYMYKGEVDVEQNKLSSLLKTAESLRIKGLGVPDERQTKSPKNSFSNDDVASAQPYSPPAKRRRHDSNADLVSPNQPSHTSSNTSSNVNQEDETVFVKVECDDSLGEVNLRTENTHVKDIETVHDPTEFSGYNILKKECEPENYDCTSLPGPSSQKFPASDNRQKESLVVNVGLVGAKEPGLSARQKHNYEIGAGNFHDPLGGGNASSVFSTEHSQEYYGATSSLPGAYLPQNTTNGKTSHPWMSSNSASARTPPSFARCYLCNEVFPEGDNYIIHVGGCNGQQKVVEGTKSPLSTALPRTRATKSIQRGAKQIQTKGTSIANVTKRSVSEQIGGSDPSRCRTIAHPRKLCVEIQDSDSNISESSDDSDDSDDNNLPKSTERSFVSQHIDSDIDSLFNKIIRK